MSRPRFLLPQYVQLFALLVAMASSGCSLLGQRDVVDADTEGSPEAPKNVSKEQYDQLLSKYEALVREKQMGATGQENAPAEKDPSTLVDELGKAQARPELAETVDVFGKDNSGPIGMTAPVGDMQVEEQIKSLNQAHDLIGKNQFDGAMSLLRSLEKSEVGQVRVRAKSMIGELLMRQGEFDLAMQVFEEVIHKDAFSGVVIKVLGKLIVCTEKLKLEKKKEQYYSMLHDFFEAE